MGPNGVIPERVLALRALNLEGVECFPVWLLTRRIGAAVEVCFNAETAFGSRVTNQGDHRFQCC